MPSKSLCLAPCEGEHFVFTLDSDALSRVNIPKGSRLLACSTHKARDGDLIVVDTPQGTLVRYVKNYRGGLCLDARDPDIPLLVVPKHGAIIQGVVCAKLYR